MRSRVPAYRRIGRAPHTIAAAGRMYILLLCSRRNNNPTPAALPDPADTRRALRVCNRRARGIAPRYLLLYTRRPFLRDSFGGRFCRVMRCG